MYITSLDMDLDSQKFHKLEKWCGEIEELFFLSYFSCSISFSTYPWDFMYFCTHGHDDRS